jgi:hypothetical protein
MNDTFIRNQMRPLPTEAQEQAVVVAYLLLKKIPHFMVPNDATWAGALRAAGANAGKVHQIIAAMKCQGLTPGAPDLVVITRSGVLFLEMKRQKRGKQSDAQKRFQALVESRDQRYFVAHGAKEAILKIEQMEGAKKRICKNCAYRTPVGVCMNKRTLYDVTVEDDFYCAGYREK